MARLDEIAEGLANMLLALPAPEPLPVDLRGHSPADFAFLARALAEACERLAAPLSLIKIDPALGAKALQAAAAEPLAGGRVKLMCDPLLDGRIELFRFPEGAD